MITSTGNISESYRTIDTVFAFCSEEEGCSGLQVLPVYQKAVQQLKEMGGQVGGNAVINIGFSNRMAISKSCGSTSRVFEVIAWGTVVEITG